MKRRTDLSKLSHETFDIAIIGGGITGAGIFQEASKRGYKCLLIEKGDFASGTSSKSAKLIHGGVRYLKYGKIGLVMESLEERNHLLKNYPHLVKPLPFIFPVYDSKLKYQAGMALYQFLSKGNDLPEYRFMNVEETLRHVPVMDPKGLKGSFLYFDAVSNDARLCNEVIHETMQSYPGSVAVSYCEVISHQSKNSANEIVCKDHLENHNVHFKANYIVTATGVWVDEILKKLDSPSKKISAPSKGIHFVLSKERFPVEDAIIIPSSAGDNRLLYGLPWENDSYIIGTTDTDFNGNPDKVEVEEDDIDYILSGLNHFAPKLKITRKDILYAYAGLRPLINEDKESKARSRDYQIWWSGKNILNIFGGKLTSFHSMAKSLLEEFEKKAGKKKIPAVPKRKPPLKLHEKMDEMKEDILARYAGQAVYVLEITDENPALCELLDEETKIYLAELVYFIRYQQCYHLDDLLFRRLSLGYVLKKYDHAETIVRKAAEIMKEECGWTEEEMKQEIFENKRSDLKSSDH